MPRKPTRIAAIDIGTNSIHMIIAETRGRGYRVADREKEMAQLGLSSLDGEPLTAEAIERGVTTLTRMSQIAARWEVAEVFAVATSAVREAPNRREFLRRVREAAGIKVKVISGEEEADYIFRAVRNAVDLNGRTALCIDIGGGSVELIVGTTEETYFARSEPLGALRLAQRFTLQNVPADGAVDDCRRWVAARILKPAKRIRHLGVDVCVGTSGTILALAAICGTGEEEVPTSGLRVLERSALRDLIPKLASMNVRERAAAFSIDEKRAGSILAGAIALDEMLTLLEVDSLLACNAAMREGILESRVAALTTSQRTSGSVRGDSALALATRSDCDIKHAQHVARLAGRIFDQTRGLHGLPATSRELLEHAALLHETGRHVSDRAHHKHSYYLIRHGDLRGFTEDQILTVANVARYYRKAAPDASHRNLMELSAAQRTEVEKLVAILRIAEALDRGHQQRVRDIGVRVTDDEVKFEARTRADATVELASAQKRGKYFADLFSTHVNFGTA
jgi:exopolyphosphatase/guanosine-5'-triphosphate,3'-diphosphate pyrophosphatase